MSTILRDKKRQSRASRYEFVGPVEEAFTLAQIIARSELIKNVEDMLAAMQSMRKELDESDTKLKKVTLERDKAVSEIYKIKKVFEECGIKLMGFKD